MFVIYASCQSSWKHLFTQTRALDGCNSVQNGCMCCIHVCVHTQLANGWVDWCNSNRDGGHSQTVLCRITALLLARHSVWILLTHFSCCIHCFTLSSATSIHLAQGSLKMFSHWVDRSLWHLLHLSFSWQEVGSPLRDEWQLQRPKEGKKTFVLLNLCLKRKCKVST